MKLERKKELIARTLGVGKARIVLNQERLTEIKEAITKQDIKDLVQSKAITIKQPQGKKKKEKRKTRRRKGSIKQKPSQRKKEYIAQTRKLRAFALQLKKAGKLNAKDVKDLRKQIRSREFRSLNHFKEHIKEIQNETA